MYSSTVQSVEKITYDQLLGVRRKVNRNTVKLWLVLPFVSGFAYTKVRRAIGELLEVWQKPLNSMFASNVSVQISFKNDAPNIERLLRS